MGLFVLPAIAEARPAKSRAKAVPLVLELHTRATPQMPAIHRRLRITLPAGWTPEMDPNGRMAELFGPGGVGRIQVCAALHPSGLDPVLDALKQEHPSAAPSPPEAMKLPGLRPDRQERATRFRVTGKEVGEMVLIEKDASLLLVVSVVEPQAWPALRRALQASYRSLVVEDIPQASPPPWQRAKGATRASPSRSKTVNNAAH